MRSLCPRSADRARHRVRQLAAFRAPSALASIGAETRCTMWSPVAHSARVHIMLGVSAVLHGAALAAWRPPTITPPRLAASEPIEVALVGIAAPREVRVVPHPATAATAQRAPAASLREARAVDSQPPPHAGAGRDSEEPPRPTAGEPGTSRSGTGRDAIVEARSDVASLNNPKPLYPLAARRRGIEGQVLIAAHVRSDGTCAEVQLKRSSGHALLDTSALDAVRGWRFLPAQRSGTPIDSWVDVPVRFRLDG